MKIIVLGLSFILLGSIIGSLYFVEANHKSLQAAATQIQHKLFSTLYHKQLLHTSPHTSGDISTFFCHNFNCTTIYEQVIRSARHQLLCAFYELKHPTIVRALEDMHQQGVNVKLITDAKTIHVRHQLPQIAIAQGSGFGLMHHKFCIADPFQRISSQPVSVVGSANPTINGLEKNDNVLFIVRNRLFAFSLYDEFFEMWSGIYRKGEVSSYPSQIIIEPNKSISFHFCPEEHCLQELLSVIDLANKSIYIAAFSFTHPKIVEHLIAKHQQGIKIEVLFEKRMGSSRAAKLLLDQQNITTHYDSNKNTMHHKLVIIDNKIVVTGSMNFSKNGVNLNDELLLILHNEEIANRAFSEFMRLKTVKLG